MEKIKEKFKKIEDQRHQSYTEHRLCDILIIIMCAVLCGIDQLEEIVSYGKNKKEFLKTTFNIEKIPSKPTLSRILRMIDPEKIGKIIMEIMKENVNELGNIIAVDGKAIRSTSEKNKTHSALQVLTAYCTKSGVVIGQDYIAHEDKTNEIPVFQKMIDLIDVKNRTITADAMHCQKETCRKIIQANGDYCFGLKENQKTLYDDVEYFFDNCDLESEIEIATTTEKHNGRFEKRTCYKILNVDWILERHNWAGLKSVFAINRITTTKYGTSHETSYYISSLSDNAEKLMNVVREHWKIESMHWLLDVVFSEDNCNLGSDEGQKTLNSFRKLALLFHKNYINKQSRKRPIKGNMFDCLLVDSKLVTLLESL